MTQNDTQQDTGCIFVTINLNHYTVPYELVIKNMFMSDRHIYQYSAFIMHDYVDWTAKIRVHCALSMEFGTRTCTFILTYS